MRNVLIVILILCGTLAARAVDPLEGRWQINGRGALVDIVPAVQAPGLLEMRIVDASDMSIVPGTVVATITPAAHAGLYDCRASKDPRKAHSRRGSVAFTISFNSDESNTGNIIDFNFYHHRRRVSLWRWLPYLFHISVINPPDNPSHLDGARRVGAPAPYIVI